MKTLMLLTLAVVVGLIGCGPSQVERNAAAMTGGHPQRGRAVILKYGCNACHLIPGVPEARGLVGPSLEGIASRVYLAGEVNNTPQNLIRWIRDPQGIEPRTAMPNMGVTEQDGRDIAAFLYTLR